MKLVFVLQPLGNGAEDADPYEYMPALKAKK